MEQKPTDLDVEIEAKIKEIPKGDGSDAGNVMISESAAFWDFITLGQHNIAERMLVKYPNLLTDARIAVGGEVIGNILQVYNYAKERFQGNNPDCDQEFMNFISKHKSKFAPLFSQEFKLSEKIGRASGLTKKRSMGTL